MHTKEKWQVRFLSVVLLVFVLDRLTPYFTSVAALTVMASGLIIGIVLYMNSGDALGFFQTQKMRIQTRPSRSKS